MPHMYDYYSRHDAQRSKRLSCFSRTAFLSQLGLYYAFLGLVINVPTFVTFGGGVLAATLIGVVLYTAVSCVLWCWRSGHLPANSTSTRIPERHSDSGLLNFVIVFCAQAGLLLVMVVFNLDRDFMVVVLWPLLCMPIIRKCSSVYERKMKVTEPPGYDRRGHFSVIVIIVLLTVAGLWILPLGYMWSSVPMMINGGIMMGPAVLVLVIYLMRCLMDVMLKRCSTRVFRCTISTDCILAYYIGSTYTSSETVATLWVLSLVLTGYMYVCAGILKSLAEMTVIGSIILGVFSIPAIYICWKFKMYRWYPKNDCESAAPQLLCLVSGGHLCASNGRTPKGYMQHLCAFHDPPCCKQQVKYYVTHTQKKQAPQVDAAEPLVLAGVHVGPTKVQIG